MSWILNIHHIGFVTPFNKKYILLNKYSEFRKNVSQDHAYNSNNSYISMLQNMV